MKNNFRSGCPIASTLDIIGDKWSLLIVRDMLLNHKMTFKEFSMSEEQIAPSILSSRLKLLTSYGLITKQKRVDNKKENIYILAEKTIELSSILIDISIWGDKHLRKFNEIDNIEGLNLERSLIVSTIKKRYYSMIQDIKIIN
ncbi:helix-turn-helix transcriptional regulator [Saprospiraceae bacterium]|jgi:DNA-binding HxlR family transcriptional regulator|nr:helix-turn-helix transcriptional regulator [Saprospiraceae bacterium]MDB4768899.1 helix-turn-helix transcriptional regulator [Saprospiraceae bacterium]MDC3253560.1 helix-turn-helix transcriptional regulator [bacterium]MDG1434831.1 helix-turn-helix domain-containing protein [Saprospiraceae bacterium]